MFIRDQPFSLSFCCSGYMPPEYVRVGHFSDKTDIYGFGVLLLEIVSGMKSVSFFNSERALTLVEYVSPSV